MSDSLWEVEIIDQKIVVDVGPGYISDGMWRALSDIPGGRWSKLTRTYKYPVDWLVCKDIRKVAQDLGVEIDIGPDLWEWASKKKEEQDRIPDVNSLDLLEIPAVAAESPALAAALASRPFQTVGVQFAATNRFTLNADHPGLGKTIQAMGAVIEGGIRGPILVVAPRVASGITWPNEIRRWLPGERFGTIGAHLSGKEREEAIAGVRNWCRENPDERFWVFCGPNYLRIKAALDDKGNYKMEGRKKVITLVREAVAELFATEWAAVIVDESQQTLATATGNKKKWSAQRLGLQALTLRPDGMKIALSGTPTRANAEYLWGTLNWLLPNRYTSFWAWAKRHFYMETDEFFARGGGGAMQTAMKVTSNIIDEKKLYEELSNVMIRRTKKEVVKDLPPKAYAGVPLDPNYPDENIAIWLEPTKKQRQQMGQLARHAIVSGKNEQLMVNGALAQITRQRQLANATADVVNEKLTPITPSNKVDWILDWLLERQLVTDGSFDQKVIIASQFTSWLNMFGGVLKEMGIAYHIITGETSDKRRQEAQITFQNPGGPQVFLLNIEAGGVSLTLDAADDVIIVDSSGDPTKIEQVEDRAHRISRMHQVTIWRLCTLGSLEEAIAVKQDSKEQDLSSLLDGSRGQEFAKTLINYIKEAN